MATYPSDTDLTQHHKLAEQHSRLLSAIFVEDGWVRFWGEALEQGWIDIAVQGGGVSKEEDDGASQLYRLSA